MNSRISIFILLSIATFGKVYASNISLIEEFLESNQAIFNTVADTDIARLNLEIAKKKSWYLSGSTSYTDSSSESVNTFGLNSYELLNHSLTLSKSNFYGGSFSFTNSLSEYDLPATVTTPANTQYEFKQTISYTQSLLKNFFGKSDRLNVLSSKENYDAQVIMNSAKAEKELLLFYYALLDARKSKTLLGLEKEALERAQRRYEYILKRFKDHTSDKVDLLSAEISLKGAKESLDSAESSLVSNINTVSELIHRKFSKSEVSILKLDKITSNLPQKSINENLTLKYKSELKEVLYSQSEIAKNNLLPSLDLKLSYSSNDFNLDRMNSVEDGKLGSDHVDLGASLNLTWEIGEGVSRRQYAKNYLEYVKNLRDIEQSKKSLQGQERSILKNIEVLDKNINSAKERLMLSKNLLVEYNKLYKLGRADIDAIIRSEENLINTEKVLLNYKVLRIKQTSLLNTVYGNLKNELLSREVF